MNGALYLADVMGGQKTGLFFDQRPNHAFAAQFARGARVLDVFSHVGGFSLAALAGGATQALAVDGSAPALALAREGFPMYADLQQKIRRTLGTMDATMQAVFAPGGTVPAVGANFKQPDLARTLEAVIRDGAAALYSPGGAIARDLDRYMRENGGLIRTADLAGYRVLQSQPLWGEYRGHRIAIMPPPSSAR